MVEGPAPSRPIDLAGAGFLVLALAALLVGAAPAAQQAPPGQRVALFAVDAADWRIIDPLVATGRLPTFARLKRVGALGVLRADPPLLSPIIWTTIATGREPQDHGVLDFMVDLPGGGQAPVSGDQRRTKALWEIWSDAGRRSLVTAWWASWPADRVLGLVVSDRIATPHLRDVAQPEAGLVHPPDRLREVLGHLVKPDAIGFEELAKLLPLDRREFDEALAAERTSTSRLYRNPIAHLRAALAATRSIRRISTTLAAAVSPDFWAAYYEITDTVPHLFIRDRARGEAAIASAYAEVDAALADTARALSPDTFLLVLSDHGFEPADAAIREDPSDLTAGATAWHRPYGIVAATTAGALAGVSPAPPLAPVGTLTPLDVAPTLLARAGLAVAADMPGWIVAALAPSRSPARIASHGAHVPAGAASTADPRIAASEIERLRALGYISGAKATSSLARVNLGEILFRKGDYRGALRELEALIRAEPLNERGALWLARTYVALGQNENALRVYDRLIQAARSTSTAQALDPLVFLAATDIDLARGRRDLASARLARVPAALVTAPEVLVARGALAEAEGRIAEAERRYRQALEAVPSDADALGRLVDLLIRADRVRDAASLAERAARIYPSSATHLSLAGETALAERRLDDAAGHFEKALELMPEAWSAREELARVRLLQGRAQAALDLVANAPATIGVETLRGAALARLARWPDAIRAFESALARGPTTPELLNGLGEAQLQAGRPGDAVKTLERSLAIKPDQPHVRTLIDTARKQVR